MFKISHELPINMLDKSFDINDYEYCLPHLLDQNEEYKNILPENLEDYLDTPE